MKIARDFRNIAREALNGKWKNAILVGVIATLLGVGQMGPDVNVDIDASGASASLKLAGQTILSTGGGLNSDIGAFLVGGFTTIVILSLIMAVAYFVLGSIITVGYAKYNLNLVDRLEGNIDNLFSYFSNWKVTVLARLLRGIYVFLWSILLVIPGIVASYKYAMVEYILAENPELTASEAISKSKQMMDGNKWRLFCLHCSFIGWEILCVFTFGIGYLWLNPYKQAATAAFYREIAETESFNG